eukprot:1160706-Pelagomonas_calceolata.AAC.7
MAYFWTPKSGCNWSITRERALPWKDGPNAAPGDLEHYDSHGPSATILWPLQLCSLDPPHRRTTSSQTHAHSLPPSEPSPNSNTSSFVGAPPPAGVKDSSNFPGPGTTMSLARYWSP